MDSMDIPLCAWPRKKMPMQIIRNKTINANQNQQCRRDSTALAQVDSDPIMLHRMAISYHIIGDKNFEVIKLEKQALQ